MKCQAFMKSIPSRTTQPETGNFCLTSFYRTCHVWSGYRSLQGACFHHTVKKQPLDGRQYAVDGSKSLHFPENRLLHWRGFLYLTSQFAQPNSWPVCYYKLRVAYKNYRFQTKNFIVAPCILYCCTVHSLLLHRAFFIVAPRILYCCTVQSLLLHRAFFIVAPCILYCCTV
jgi:hypothetical protein